MRENFHLSCRGSYKSEEGDYSLAVRGDRGLHEKISEKKWCKWCFLSLFCRLIVNIFSKIVWDFCDDPEDKRNARVCSPLRLREGIIFLSCEEEGPTHFFFFVLKSGCKWCIWIHSLPIGCCYFIEMSHFCHESPDVEGMWYGSFPSYADGVFSSCRRGPWFTVPLRIFWQTDAIFTLKRFYAIEHLYYT